MWVSGIPEINWDCYFNHQSLFSWKAESCWQGDCRAQQRTVVSLMATQYRWVLQLPPVNRNPRAPLFPWLCFHVVLLLEHFSKQDPEQGVCLCDHAPRLNPPQIKSQKKLWCFPELRICPYSINVTLPPSRALFRWDTEQHLIKANVSGMCTAPQIPQKWSFLKNHLDATKWAINVEIS